MHKILIPVDGSNHSLKALQIAADLGLKYSAKLLLLHVLAKGKDAGDLLGLPASDAFDKDLRLLLEKADAKGLGEAPTTVLERAGEAILNHAKGRVERLGLEVGFLPIVSGDPAHCILKAQKETKASTIVMGARGVAFQPDGSFGSVSQKVFQSAPCTCLSVK